MTCRRMSIRKASKEPDINVSENLLRGMVKRQECPGFYSGVKFLVDVDQLAEILKKRSAAFTTAEEAKNNV